MSRSMFSAWGPERSLPQPRELPFDEVGAQVEEAQGAEPAGERVPEDPLQRRARDRAPAEPGHHAVDGDRKAAERQPHVLLDDAAEPDRERLLHHDHPAGARERGADLVRGYGRKQRIASAPTRSPRSRSLSTTSSIAPSTEPSATTTVSASSSR